MNYLFSLTSCIFLLLTATACTQVKGTLTRACDITRMPLSTGYDHLNGQLLSPGQQGPKWIIIRDRDASYHRASPVLAIVARSAG